MAPNVKMCFCSFFVAENRKKLREGTFGLALKINSICDTFGELRRGAKKKRKMGRRSGQLCNFSIELFCFLFILCPLFYSMPAAKSDNLVVLHTVDTYFFYCCFVFGWPPNGVILQCDSLKANKKI